METMTQVELVDETEKELKRWRSAWDDMACWYTKDELYEILVCRLGMAVYTAAIAGLPQAITIGLAKFPVPTR